MKHIYDKLYSTFGAQGWWPGDSQEEIIIGAVLTQNTNWSNVDKAIANLKECDALSLKALAEMDLSRLSRLIRPSGYFNIKAKRLRSVARFFHDIYRSDFGSVKKVDLGVLRDELLEVYGIGEETADSILLYALGKPTFVVDAYTKRFGARHGFFPEKCSYGEIKRYFEKRLLRDVGLYNEFHALIVHLGKEFCRPKPLCAKCPLHFRKYYRKSER